MASVPAVAAAVVMAAEAKGMTAFHPSRTRAIMAKTVKGIINCMPVPTASRANPPSVCRKAALPLLNARISTFIANKPTTMAISKEYITVVSLKSGLLKGISTPNIMKHR
jgi:hypothetical protein